MVSKEFIEKTVSEAIDAREKEVFGYEFNIKNYELMIARLPSEVRSVPADPLIAAQHKLRDELAGRILAERIQLQTAQLVLDVLISQRTESPQ